MNNTNNQTPTNQTISPASAEYLASVSQVVLETALVRLTASLDDAQVTELNTFLAATPDHAEAMRYVLEKHPVFTEIMHGVAAEIEGDMVDAVQAVK